MINYFDRIQLEKINQIYRIGKSFLEIMVAIKKFNN